MEKHKKINLDQINNIIDDEKDKFSNKMYFDESETKSCIDNENKTKQFIDFLNIPIDYQSSNIFNFPYECRNNFNYSLLYGNNMNYNLENFQYNLNQYPTDLLKIPIRTLNDEEFVYVNLKQYRRIMIRRKQREKVILNQRLTNFSCSTNKPRYQHESRHRHACTRERGKGGRFTSKKEDNSDNLCKNNYSQGQENLHIKKKDDN